MERNARLTFAHAIHFGEVEGRDVLELVGIAFGEGCAGAMFPRKATGGSSRGGGAEGEDDGKGDGEEEGGEAHAKTRRREEGGSGDANLAGGGREKRSPRNTRNTRKRNSAANVESGGRVL